MFESCDMKWLEERPETFAQQPAGTFWWELLADQHGRKCRRLYVMIPCRNVTDLHALVVWRPGIDHRPAVDRVWEWDGDVLRPTLNPSIASGPPNNRRWHGYIRKGRLEAV